MSSLGTGYLSGKGGVDAHKQSLIRKRGFGGLLLSSLFNIIYTVPAQPDSEQVQFVE